MTTDFAVPSFRRPEYTGANRCIPCTLVNVALAVALAASAYAALSGQTATGAATTVLAASSAAIYWRGYLVPGTPALTRRYLPPSVLGLFDAHGADRDAIKEVDVETVLLDAEILRPQQAGEDFTLDPAFLRAWRDNMDALHAAGDGAFKPLHVRRTLLDDVDADVALESVGEDSITAVLDGVRIAQWESRAAYLADAAAIDVLAERVPGWDRFGFDARTEVLAGLRLWLDTCPVCEAPVTLREDTVESCCRAVDVVAADCQGCGARVFEIERLSLAT